ncbi:hypothetical protein M655_013380 [Brevibacillus sp. NSP2.1]|nr:hypothetical protein M655_013380 [Brevibacillus sp. NSP2.1]
MTTRAYPDTTVVLYEYDLLGRHDDDWQRGL